MVSEAAVQGHMIPLHPAYGGAVYPGCSSRWLRSREKQGGTGLPTFPSRDCPQGIHFLPGGTKYHNFQCQPSLATKPLTHCRCKPAHSGSIRDAPHFDSVAPYTSRHPLRCHLTPVLDTALPCYLVALRVIVVLLCHSPSRHPHIM